MSQFDAFVRSVSVFLYRFLMPVYTTGIRIAGYFTPKAAQWYSGRQSQAEEIARLDPGISRIWFHCASLGEFEQARPVIESIRQRYPQCPVVLTFYSPSGYEPRKHYPFAERVFYLPIDHPKNAARFIASVHPSLVVFVKYDMWYFFLQHLRKQRVPVILISALFQPDHIYFKPWGAFFRVMLTRFSAIFVQDAASASLLARRGISPVLIAGDTRIDSVLERVEKASEIPEIARFKGDASLLIAGSTWPPDEQLLAELVRRRTLQGWKIILAPHDISEKHLSNIEQVFDGAGIQRFSAYSASPASGAAVLLIDNVGMLFDVYRYGDIAYIGGGFGTGLHNTLEPAAWGLPVIIGPEYRRFAEARAFVAAGAAYSVQNADEFARQWNQWRDPQQRKPASEAIRRWMQDNRGATGVIMQYLQTNSPEICKD